MFKRHSLWLVLAFAICSVLSCENHTNPPVIIPGEPNEINARNISYMDPYNSEQFPLVWFNDGAYILYDVENVDEPFYYSYGWKPVKKDITNYELYSVYYEGFSANIVICFDDNDYLYYTGQLPSDGACCICKDYETIESNPEPLTFPWAISNNPQLSPDNTQIVFDSQRESPNHSDVYIMPIEGELEGGPAVKISNNTSGHYSTFALFTNEGQGIVYFINYYYKIWYYYNVLTEETRIYELPNNVMPLQWLGSGDLFLAINVDLTDQGKFPVGYIDLADCVFHPFFPDATCFSRTHVASLSPDHRTLAFITQVTDTGERDVFLVEVEVPPLN